MGMYDTYWSEKPTEENMDKIVQIQMKNGPCTLNNYTIGSKVDIPNGIYVAPDGIVVILKKKVAMVTDNFDDKWGINHVLDYNKLGGKLWKLLIEDNSE
jgi:hypothetical protein